MIVRPAIDLDIPRLQEIEVLAGAAFVGLGMSAIAEDDPPSSAELKSYIDGSRCWVAIPSDLKRRSEPEPEPETEPIPIADAGALAAAYVVVDIVDGQAHIEQISVDPAFSRRGIGKQLIEHACEWAAGRGCSAVTLTTFELVPWNAPYYARCGFRILQPKEVGPELAQLREQEVEHGLDRWPRVCMSRDL